MNYLEQTWRWYGPNDPVTLDHVKQAGATGIVTALHHIPIGEVWTVDEINKRKDEVESKGLKWSVVESLSVSELVKTQTGEFKRHLENYKTSLVNLGKCGIDTVCYNVMPVLDWTRTHLNHPFHDGSTALAFDHIDFAAFDLYIMKRNGAKKDYNDHEIKLAKEVFSKMSDERKKDIIDTVVAGLPGTDQHFGLDTIKVAMQRYETIDETLYREHIRHFLEEVTPIAAENGVKLAVHPDDPPFRILGLPRIVSTAEDARTYLKLFDHPNNGLTFCTGSYGAHPDNDVVAMSKEFADRIHFVHLRNVTITGKRTFHEDNHLEGGTDMYEMMLSLVETTEKRAESRPLPYRPDHGHRMLDDLPKQRINPGYTGIGRLRGLAELRGLELGIRRSRS